MRKPPLNLNAVVKVNRRTTWRCGRLQEAILRIVSSNGGGMTVQDVVTKFGGSTPPDVKDALRRLERRGIIEFWVR